MADGGQAPLHTCEVHDFPLEALGLVKGRDVDAVSASGCPLVRASLQGLYKRLDRRIRIDGEMIAPQPNERFKQLTTLGPSLDPVA